MLKNQMMVSGQLYEHEVKQEYEFVFYAQKTFPMNLSFIHKVLPKNLVERFMSQYFLH